MTTLSPAVGVSEKFFVLTGFCKVEWCFIVCIFGTEDELERFAGRKEGDEKSE